MPLIRCQKDGKSGWKWGSSGACFTGPGGKQRAIDQGLASGELKVADYINMVFSPFESDETGVIRYVQPQAERQERAGDMSRGGERRKKRKRRRLPWTSGKQVTIIESD